jgi:Domain of Unknown Function (DUF1080)
MNTHRRSSLCLAAWLFVLTATAGAAPPEKLMLFDGKSLDGWKKTDFVHPGEVKVEDGALILGAGRSMTGITSTRQDLPKTNYELSYEATRVKGRDFFAAATFPVGKSHITLVNGGWGGHVTGLSSLDGSDASENETSCAVKYQDKTPHRFRVWVSDKVIRCWVDDVKVIAVSIEGRQVDTRIETDANKPLGFATYETTGALRKVEVRPLTPAEVAENNKAAE